MEIGRASAENIRCTGTGEVSAQLRGGAVSGGVFAVRGTDCEQRFVDARASLRRYPGPPKALPADEGALQRVLNCGGVERPSWWLAPLIGRSTRRLCQQVQAASALPPADHLAASRGLITIAHLALRDWPAVCVPSAALRSS